MSTFDMRMRISKRNTASSQAGFSLLEMVIVCAILTLVLSSIFGGINTAIQRSQAEQVKVNLVQEGREFIDEFERDLHQAGYPNCHMIQAVNGATKYTCPADMVSGLTQDNNEAMSSTVAVGIAYLSNTKIIFEGDVDGDGVVDSVQYALVDSAGNDPPSGNCPCYIKRSQVQKLTSNVSPLAIPATWSQELQNVVNSGTPGVDALGNPLAYGGGLSIAGNTTWGQTNSAYYAAVTSFKDYPVFQAYDQSGTIIALNPALDITNLTNSQILNCAPNVASNCLKTIRITINLLADATTGVDMQTNVRPVITLMGDARLVNNVGNNY
jgi:prepilin-type N-terminal cleavage/methylation domain-containing protein